jgi:hypothetical protein
VPVQFPRLQKTQTFRVVGDFEASGITDVDSSQSAAIDVYVNLDYLDRADLADVFDASVENYNWELSSPPSLADIDVATPGVVGTWVILLEVTSVGEDTSSGLLKSY